MINVVMFAHFFSLISTYFSLKNYISKKSFFQINRMFSYTWRSLREVSPNFGEDRAQHLTARVSPSPIEVLISHENISTEKRIMDRRDPWTLSKRLQLTTIEARIAIRGADPHSRTSTLIRNFSRGISRTSFAVAVSRRRGDDDSSPGRCFGGWQDSFYSEEVG